MAFRSIVKFLLLLQATVFFAGTEGSTTQYVVVLFDNQLDRTIRIVPSNSPRGAYFVEPRAFLQVNISTEVPDHVITFRAIDQEKQVQVLLNNTKHISLTSTEDKHLVNKLTIHPEALVVIPSHSYFLAKDDDYIAGNPGLNKNGYPKPSSSGLELDGQTNWLDGEFKLEDCLQQPDLCQDGFSLSLKVADFKDDNPTQRQYILDSGGRNNIGVAMYLEQSKLYFDLTTKDKAWSVSHSIDRADSKYYYIITTWKNTTGLSMYFNAQLVASDPNGIAKTSSKITKTPNFNIARSLDGDLYGHFTMASFTTFNSHISVDKILNVYLFLWSSYMTQAYHAKVLATNMASTSATLHADNGNKFNIPSKETLELNIIDVAGYKQTTTVQFTATKANSEDPLLIEGSQAPFKVELGEYLNEYDVQITEATQ